MSALTRRHDDVNTEKAHSTMRVSSGVLKRCLLVLVFCTGACVAMPPESIGCSELRSLRLGMSRADVKARLGDPVGTAEGGRVWAYFPPIETRFYKTARIRLTVKFEDGALSDVYMDKKFDFDSDPSPVLYVLNHDRFIESALFAETFCPSR